MSQTRTVRADPSSFYRLNEEIALELRRLERTGALEPLQELLRAGGQELLVASVRRGEGLEELIGVLGPALGEASGPAAPASALPPALDEGGAPTACDCGPGEGAPAAARAPVARGWDSEGYLAVRSRFTVELEGEARELYMPDHVCPRCHNPDGNWIEHCGRACAACDFRW